MSVSSALRSLAPLLLAASATLAHAAAPASTHAQVPGFYLQRIGMLRVTALFDGSVALTRRQLSNVAPAERDRLLAQGYVPEDGKGLQTAVNAYLIQDGRHLSLVDTGTAQCLGPGLGQVLSNLRAAGYDPAQVDDVLLTHAHPDHLCGLLDAQGTPAFPNATVWLSEADAAYWLDPASEAGASEAGAAPTLQFAFPLARAAVAPYQAQGRLRRFQPGISALPAGITALDSQGHTPGHVSYRFDGGTGNTVLVWGDVLHYHAVQFARPDASFEADSDRSKAIASRRRLLAQAADGRWWVAGAHLPFPGLGHVRREGKAFAWVPTEFGAVPQ
ncbi:MBL fold metallo-hydrolase [Xanthomonas arboricola pv. juglandis]|uniref:Metallo-beta-lactamase domain-containing protein n=2 Tax=Xanthomonas arboricola TaxID=56448 RepID=A0A2S7CKM3_9XANT|nr:MBL fold metallo-hydrolase [Xanthomonas arboricola]AKU49638.1 beta-lactamase [Xanthomonas arboricola pv. juglandis]KOA96594.1 beta-lactamase [Xanthomonas arboricola]KOB06548.1 beta-lactamase [Xanthomonas arboricola]KOB10843.1 beta-lactamase [Xanthomonas arboricola]KOB21537.1 beta-lactamase [Xanthomonas arboricola]